MTRLVAFRVGEWSLGVDVTAVGEVVRDLPVSPVPGAPPEVLGLVSLRGQVLAVLDLRHRLGLAAAVGTGGPAGHLLVLRTGSEPQGLLVDQVDGVLDVDPATATDPPPTLGPTARAVIATCHPLPAGLLHVLDPDRLGAA